MGMIADMLLTVAMVALAAGTVAELSVRMGHIGLSADDAAVIVRCPDGSGGGFIGTGTGEGDDLRLLRGMFLLLAEQTLEIGPPGNRDHIQHILAEEQEIVGKGNDGEQIRGEGIGNESVDDQNKIDQSEDPCLYRDHKEQQEMGVGIQCGIGKKQAQIQVVDIRLTAEDHAVNVHHHDAAEVKQIEFQRAPDIFHGTSQREVAHEIKKLHDHIATVGQQGIGEQPPDFTPEDSAPVEAENFVKKRILCGEGKQVHHRGTENQIEHQIWDALVPVSKTETFKIFAQVHEVRHSRKVFPTFYQ